MTGSFDHAVQPRLTQREVLSAPFITVITSDGHLPESPYQGQPVLIASTGELKIYHMDDWLTAGVPSP